MRRNTNFPAAHAVALTPNDDNDLARTCRSLWVGDEGDLYVVLVDDSTPILFANASGAVPVQVKRLFATGTTATRIVALY